MDLEKLNSININNAAQVKELQQFLKTRGYYNGPIDGKWGGGTTEGAVKLRGDLTTARDANVRISENQVIANDPTRNAIRGATEIGPYVGGAVVGAAAGHFGARAMNTKDAAQAAETTRIAGNPKISGQVGMAKIDQMNSARRLRAGGQFLAPAALLGSAEYIRSHVAPMKNDKGEAVFDPETQKWINLGANADQGAGLGLAAHQLYDLKNRFGSPASAADEAIIQTRALPPAPPPPMNALDAAGRASKPPQNALGAAAPPPEDGPPAAPTKTPYSDRLIAAARAAGARGPLTKQGAADYLEKNLNDQNRGAVAKALNVKGGRNIGSRISTAIKTMASRPGASSMVGPLVAGGLAYELAGEPVEAADGSTSEPSTGNRLAAAGAGAGIAYGAQKGLNAIPKGGGAMFGGAMGPSVIDAMTDAYIPADSPAYQESKRQEDMRASDAGQQTNAFLARNLPSALHFGEIARQDVSNVPSPNPMRTTPEPGNPYFPLSSQPMEEPPKNALDAAGRVPTEFGTALQEFLAMVKEMQAEMQQDPTGEQPPAPLPGNFRAAPAMAGAMN